MFSEEDYCYGSDLAILMAIDQARRSNTPKVAFLKLPWQKVIRLGARRVCPFCDWIVNREH
jgi:hypothetical protein